MQTRLTTIATGLVAFVAAVVSYVHIFHVAHSHGADPFTAALLPLSIDGVVAVASAKLLSGDLRSLVRMTLLLAVVATLAANVAYGLAYGPVGALVSAWPAVAFLCCIELLAHRVHPAKTCQTALRATQSDSKPAPKQPIREPAVRRSTTLTEPSRTMPRPIIEPLIPEARSMVADNPNVSVNELAKRFSIAWVTAKKLKAAAA